MDEFERRMRDRLQTLADRGNSLGSEEGPAYQHAIYLMDEIRTELAREATAAAEAARLKAEEDAKNVLELVDKAQPEWDGTRWWTDEDIERTGRYYVTACLPNTYGDHYDVEDELVEQGLLRREQCDSESGQFFAAVDGPEQAKKINEYLFTHPHAGNPTYR